MYVQVLYLYVATVATTQPASSHLASHLPQPESSSSSAQHSKHVKYISLHFSQPQPAEAGEPATASHLAP